MPLTPDPYENAPDAEQGIEGNEPATQQRSDSMSSIDPGPDSVPIIYRELRIKAADPHDTNGLVSIYFDGSDWLLWVPWRESSSAPWGVRMVPFNPSAFAELVGVLSRALATSEAAA